jgi:hypothetical protein
MQPEWQRGIAIETLRGFAAPFLDRHKPLVFGAFGLTKETDLAAALAEKRVIWSGDPPKSIALCKITSMAMHQHDFTGRELNIPPPVLRISAFVAGDAATGAKVLKAAIERAPQGRVVAELFEEDTFSRHIAEQNGLAYVATKIGAGSEVKGLYVRGLPAFPPLADSDHPALLVLTPDYLGGNSLAAVRAELSGAGLPWEQHYSSYNKRRSWTAFALRGYGDDPHFVIKPAEMAKSWQASHPEEMRAAPRWTSAAAGFPATMAMLEASGFAFDRVRFMRLAPRGGELSRHADITDRDAGTADRRITRLHIPIVTSAAVTFHAWDARGHETRQHLPEGALCYLDQRKPHRVTNLDPTLYRIHLVADALGCPELRELIRRPAARDDERPKAVA